MALKRNTSSPSADVRQRDCHSLDNDVNVSKRRKINEDSEIISVQNTESISKYVRVRENESCPPGNSFDFVEKSGPKHQLPVASKPIDYFNLFFTDSLWEMMVEETNRYAEELLLTSMINAKSRLLNWYPVTVLEMKAFLAVLLEMGITRRPTIHSYWAVNSRAIPWFKNMFSRNRFQNLLRCFHLIDNQRCFPPGHEKYDACAEFTPILDHSNQVFKMHYTPHKILTVNESLVGTPCHSNIAQDVPNKKHPKWGMKFWVLCDATSKYCLSMYCHRGAKSRTSINGLGYDVVTKLLQDADCLNKGHHVYVDNFFTSTALAKFLHTKNTYITGTIKRNMTDIPTEAKEIKPAETKYFRNGEVLLCSHRENESSKNPVLLISTEASTANVTVTTKRFGVGREKAKPAIIHSFNNLMGGMDESDKLLYTYLDERRTLQYWKKVTFNILGRMVLNSYLLYKETVGGQPIPRLQYMSDIISEIEAEWTGMREDECTAPKKKPCGLEKLPGRNLRRCVICSTKTCIKRSNLICAKCKKGVHPLCFHKHVCKF